jgi:hypothetical protein
MRMRIAVLLPFSPLPCFIRVFLAFALLAFLSFFSSPLVSWVCVLHRLVVSLETRLDASMGRSSYSILTALLAASVYSEFCSMP